MSTYLYCGLTVLTNTSLPELPSSDTAEAGVIFTLQTSWQQCIEHEWSHHWLSPGGEILLSYCNQQPYHWLRFPCLADFLISTNGQEISCYPVPQIPEETIRHLLLDQVLPRCLAHQGRIMLHASAVKLDKGVVLFLGDSGAGKSTLAGNFHRAGNPVLSDDCVWIQESEAQITAVPSYAGLRLWDDSLQALFSSNADAASMAHYSSKKRVPLHDHQAIEADHSMPVLALVLLCPPDEISSSEMLLERISRREAFIALLKQTFQLDVTDVDRMTSHAQALGRIVPKVPAFRLSMARDYSLLPQVRQKILETVL